MNNEEKDYSISFINYNKNYSLFFEKCINTKEFHQFIDNSESVNRNNYKIILMNKGIPIGILNPQFTQETGVKIISPIILMENKYKGMFPYITLYSVEYFLEKFEADLIVLKVMSNNILMRNILHNLNIRSRGKIQKLIQINGKYSDLFFYTISKKQLKKIYRKKLKKWIES